MIYDGMERNNYQYIILEVDERVSGINRDQLQKVLVAEGVCARRYFYPGCHRMEPYVSRLPTRAGALPQTERVAQRVLSLPNGTAVGLDEVTAVCDVVRVAVANAPLVRKRLDEVAVGPSVSPGV
jgi:dTDP-4-amino-4,6-dideoxygalactose transaminase